MPVVITPFRKNWAKGARLDFLESHIDAHHEKRRNGRGAGIEYTHQVINVFVLKFSWWLPMHQDPPPDFVPDESTLSAEDLGMKKAALDRLVTGIGNFFENRWAAADSITRMTRAEIARNPLSAFLAKATNTRLHGQRLRGRTPAQMWSSEQFASVRQDVNQQVKEESLNAQRGRVAKAQMCTIAAFQGLPKDEQAYWKTRAAEDAEEVAQAKVDANAPLERLNAVETQEVLDNIASTFQEFLEGFAILTGGNVSLVWAGPEPRRGGQVNVISVHAGSNSATVPETFDCAAGERGKRRRKVVEAAFGEFAMECFSLTQQEKRALAGHSMPANAPSFLSQPKSWNSPAGDDSLPSTVVASRADSSPHIASSQAKTKRRREAEDSAPKKTKKRRRSKKVVSDDDDDDSDDDDDISPAASDTEKAARRKSKRADLSKKVATDGEEGGDEDDAVPDASSQHQPIPPAELPPPPASTTPPPPPEDVVPLPAWLKEAEERLQKFDLDDSFQRLVTTWVRLEARNPGSETSALPYLPATKRPAWVSYWISRGRAKEEDFTGKVATKLAKDWWTWWIALQPAVRCLKLSDAPQPDHTIQVGEDQWGALNTRGINGLLSVLMGLAWWGTVAFSDIIDWTRWLRAVSDVHWVVKQLKV